MKIIDYKEIRKRLGEKFSLGKANEKEKDAFIKLSIWMYNNSEKEV